MKSVLEYRDYHAFMQDYYDSRKKSGAFSWREFSKNAGFSSSNYLKLVCMGKSKLSKVKTAQESDNLNQVYGLNFQLFPFTNKIEGESLA